MVWVLSNQTPKISTVKASSKAPRAFSTEKPNTFGSSWTGWDQSMTQVIKGPGRLVGYIGDEILPSYIGIIHFVVDLARKIQAAKPWWNHTNTKDPAIETPSVAALLVSEDDFWGQICKLDNPRKKFPQVQVIHGHLELSNWIN